MASLSAVAFLSRGEIGGNKGHLGVPPMTYLGVVWTKVGDCGDKEARSAGTHSSPPFSQRDWIRSEVGWCHCPWVAQV